MNGNGTIKDQARIQAAGAHRRRAGSGQRPARAAVQADTAKGVMDYTIYLVVIILTLFGIVMVFSASYIITGRSAAYDFNSFHYLQRHGALAAVGFLIMNLAANVDYRIMRRFAVPLYLASIGLLIFTFFFGRAVGGASRWIEIGAFQFQPSEVAKFALILMLAYILSENRDILRSWKGFIFCSGIVGVMTVSVGIANLSTGIIIAIIGMGMIFIASPHIWRFIIGGAAGVGGMLGYLYYMANLAPQGAAGAFRGGRFHAWQDPFADSSGFGYQIINSLYAIASGGMFGLGIGQSRQKTFLPEVHNDVIFAVVVEELGSDAYVYGHVNLSGADERFVVRTDGRRTPRMGDTVFVKPRVGHHHAFHAVSGTRI